MKLVFAIKSLNVVGGGAERVLVEVANGLAERGHDLTVLTFDGPGSSFYSLHPKVARLDLAIGLPGQPTPRLNLLGGLPRMRKLIGRIHPDLVVGFMHSMYLPLGVALLGSGLPLIASEHVGSVHFQRRPLQRAMVRFGDALIVAKTVPSEVIRAEYGTSGRTPVTVLANPLALEPLQGIASQPPSDPPVILSVGRLMAEKNQSELIAAFGLLAERYPLWTLRIVGEGELRSTLEAEIKARGLEQRIELPGATRDMPQEYERAAIVAVPSRYESFGMVTAEAQACGRPVIGFADCSGTNELIVDGENGLLVSGDGDRVANLAEGLERLILDESLRLRLGVAGPEAVQKFSVKNVLNLWEDFFLKLMRFANNRHKFGKEKIL